jgi:hypothetical protein
MQKYGYQKPHHGKKASCYFYSISGLNDFAYYSLSDALLPDSMYYAEFWVSRAEMAGWPRRDLHMGLSSEFFPYPFQKSNKNYKREKEKRGDINYIPWAKSHQYPRPSLIMQNTNGLLTDSINWTKISGLFRARGGERYLTVGDFSEIRLSRADSTDWPTDSLKSVWLNCSMYYVDDIMLKPYGWSCTPASADAKNRNSVILAANKSFYFEPDKFELTALSDPALLEIADYLNAHSGSFVEICITPFPNEAKNVL